MRDSRAESAYFDRAVEAMRRSAERKERDLALPDERLRTPDLRAVSASGAAWLRAQEFSARYSRGDSPDDLRATFSVWLTDAEAAATEKARPAAERLRVAQDVPGGILSFYVSRLWLVAVACALGVDDDTFTRVIRAVEPLLADRLVSSLVATRDAAVPVAKSDWHVKRFGPLADVLSAEDRPAAVRAYLDSWYARVKGVEWWDGHRYLSKVHYVGYWSFEAAGVVAAFGIDDASFRSQEFYPANLT